MVVTGRRAQEGRRRGLWRVEAASVVGTVIESYDFALFGLGAALLFGELFFPPTGQATALLASLATFAVGFFVRPLGALVLGNLGDRVGRSPMMVFTLVLMGLATAGIGLLPTYDTVGVLAPALLVLLRLLQGFGAGAEYVGAILVVAESGGTRRRGLRASLPGTGFFLGVLLATLAFTAVSLLPAAQFASWGWRVPFLLSAVTVLVGLYFRLAVEETEAFTRFRAQDRPARFPILEVVRRRPRSVLIATAANGPMVALYYLVQVFVLSYLTGALGLPSAVGLVANIVASLVAIAAVPLCGALSDRVGRRPVWLGGSAFLMAFAFPLFWLVQTRDPVLVVTALALVAGALGAMVAAQAALFAELFETRYRFSGFALARESSAAVIAGPTPFAAAALLQGYGGATWPIALMVVALGAVAFTAVLFAPETRHVSLTDPGG
ncbi:MFS transporter [Sphaerisporangium sp. TRM90804]|uniref:MFS transporter n=1 Tax=Sphaerisporangium sp. TRM90804 TaxID=3031113 RepID=UPI00244B8429|nr:MFS transporter [Sphaerisporangium sp. TRM90804]MDH2429621.1 MFS transporter [Sphaerisporangium sp. TRM90804]